MSVSLVTHVRNVAQPHCVNDTDLSALQSHDALFFPAFQNTADDFPRCTEFICQKVGA